MILIFFKKNEDKIELRFSNKNSNSVDKNLGIFMIRPIPNNLSPLNNLPPLFKTAAPNKLILGYFDGFLSFFNEI